MRSRPKGRAVLTGLLGLLAAAATGSCMRDGAGLDRRPGDASPVHHPAPRPTPTTSNPLAGCQLCHVDVEDEYVKSRHFREKVACVKCHGPSKGHAADENNEVKPDEVFARKDVDGLCGRCHKCSRKAPPAWLRFLQGKRRVCTECHVPHGFARQNTTAGGRRGGHVGD